VIDFLHRYVILNTHRAGVLLVGGHAWLYDACDVAVHRRDRRGRAVDSDESGRSFRRNPDSCSDESGRGLSEAV